MSWEAFDKWTDRPRNIVILMILALFVGGGLAAIDTLAQSETSESVFYFCSLPYPADTAEKSTPPTGSPLLGTYCWRE